MSPFDVVIVGGGSAGCVLAARLSEDPSRRVLLLEAGPDYPSVETLPTELVSGYSLVVSHDWGFKSDGARAINTPRPKLVGGSSATNATIALRGHPSDYDAWAAEVDSRWSFREVLPFFKKLETDRDFAGEWHGQTGPLPLRRYGSQELTAVHAAFLGAAREKGHAAVEDHNAPAAVGAGLLPMNTEASVRQSAALTYLAQARGRPNLTIRSGAMVDCVVLEQGRATGVRLAGSGEIATAGEVILSAGTYCSPLILMRSGIGPAAHLAEMGIAARNDLPGVGANLADHALWAMHFGAPRPTSVGPQPMFQTMLTLGTAGGVDAQIFPASVMPCGIMQSSSGGIFALNVSPMRPKSTGRVLLSAAAPDAPPRIHLDYFTHPDDMPVMLEAIASARALAGTASLRALALQELFPGSRVESAAELEACVRRTVTTYHHPVGTCRMGPASRRDAVVDGRGAVHGVAGLSVIDASIMPKLPSANVHLATLMLAERCADLRRA